MVSIIIPTFNHLDDLLKPCLKSIIQYTELSEVEVIVVANGCTDNTADYVTGLGAPFKLVVEHEQLGFTKAVNLGIKSSKGDYVLLLNNDVILLEQPKNTWIKILKERLTPPDVGICAVSIKVSEFTDRSFGIFFCALIKREVIDKVGLLDEVFSPGFGEDMDFCHRAEDLGYKIVPAIPGETQKTYETLFPIYHVGSVSVVSDIPNYADIVERNGRYLRQKYVLVPLETQFERFVAGKGDMIGPRESARYRWARKNLKGTKVLEIGCSSGFGTTFLQDVKNLDYLGIDYNFDIIDFANRNFKSDQIKFLCVDINNFTFDTYYDTIIAFEILEHLDNGKELAQKLKQHCDCLLASTPYDEITFAEESQGVQGVNWGIHHRLHHLTQKDFNGFEYSFMSPTGEISNKVHDAEFNLMLLKHLRNSYVSIVVISHNYGRFLKACLDSVFEQKLGNNIQGYQILLVDNNSTDNTLSIFKEYQQQKSLFFTVDVLQIENTLSIPASKNYALNYTKGEYVCFIDADDYIEQNYFNKLVVPLKQDSSVGFAYSDFRHFDKSGENIVITGKYSFERLQTENFILNAALIRVAAIQEVGGYDIIFNKGMEDYDLWLSLAAKNWVGAYVNEVLYNYRKHESNRSDLSINERMKLFKLVRKKHKINLLTVAATISTKDRYFTTLPACLLSLANQTVLPDKIVIYDDGEQIDLRDHPLYANIFKLFDLKGIAWEVRFGEKRGQVFNHIKAIEELDTEFIWRVDDDNYMEANVLEELLTCMGDDEVGAVGSLALIPVNVSNNELSAVVASGKIALINTCLNLQWVRINGIHEVEHLHNTFLFRRALGRGLYPTNLSPVGHREETIFTYRIFKNGYKLLVNANAVGWHLQSPTGGIRSFSDARMYDHDEQIFKQSLVEWKGAQVQELSQNKLIILDSGLGDHFAFKHILQEVIQKYGREHLVLAVCYPEVFQDMGQLTLISIAEARALTTAQGIDFDSFNLYKWMWDRDWKGSIVEAYRSMYEA